jgi:hypothetical protein
MDFRKVQTIVDWATPTFVWDVYVFLDLPTFIDASLPAIL